MWGTLKAGLSEFTDELSKDVTQAKDIALQKLEEAEQLIEGEGEYEEVI